MSEFSESYHLRSDRAQDAVDLLRRAGRKGFVLEPEEGWVSFVADEGTFEPDHKIVVAAKHPLLHFVSAEDHGVSFTFFEAGKVVTAYGCAWENDVSVDDSRYARDALERLLPAADSSLLDEFERRMHPADIDELIGFPLARLLMQTLGLEHAEWLSYDYIASDDPDDHPGMIEVT
jgi:hypothetical protein